MTQNELESVNNQIVKRSGELLKAIQTYSLASFEDKSFLLINNLTQDLIDVYQDAAVCKREVERYETLINNK